MLVIISEFVIIQLMIKKLYNLCQIIKIKKRIDKVLSLRILSNSYLPITHTGSPVFLFK